MSLLLASDLSAHCCSGRMQRAQATDTFLTIKQDHYDAFQFRAYC